MTVGKLIARVAWQFRWRTWAMRYLSVMTFIAKKLNSDQLRRHNLSVLEKI